MILIFVYIIIGYVLNTFSIYVHYRYAVPDTPYSIGANFTTTELNTLVNTLLVENSSHKNVEFDFLVFGEYLR